MSEDGNFWFRIWSLITVFTVTLILSVVYTMAGKREVMRDMVGKGA